MLTLAEERQYKAIRNVFARVPPTPEYQQIFKRNFSRICRWADAIHPSNFMAIINRWCGDYTHNRF